MRSLRTHWKKLVVLLLFAGSLTTVALEAQPRPRAVLRSPQGFSSVSFSAAGQTVVTTVLAQVGSRRSVDHTAVVQLWDANSGHERGCFEFASINPFSHPELSPDGRLLVVEEKRGLRVTDVKSGETAALLSSNGEFKFSPDGRLLAYFADNLSNPHEAGRLTLWDTVTRSELARFDGGFRCAFSPDGRRIASVIEDPVRTSPTDYYDPWDIVADEKRPPQPRNCVVVWDIATGEKQGVLVGPSDCPCLLAFSPDGRHITCISSAHGLFGWTGLALTELVRIDLAGQFVSRTEMFTTTLPTSSQGPRITLSSTEADGESPGRSIRVWDAHTGREWGPFVKACSLHGRDASAAPSLSADGRSLLVADLVYRETNPLWARLWSCVGAQLPAGNWAYEIKFLDVETGRVQAALRHDEDSSGDQFCLSPDGKTLAVWWSNGGQAVYLWDIPPKKPWLRILAWSAGPVAGLLLMVGLYKLWSRRGRDAGLRSGASSRGD